MTETGNSFSKSAHMSSIHTFPASVRNQGDYCYLFQRSQVGGGKITRLVLPLENNLDLSIIGWTKTLKYKSLTMNNKIFGPTKVAVIGLAPPALTLKVGTSLTSQI